jgi:beta-galactosidase
VETTGAPAAVRLTSDRPKINADGEDVAMVAVAIVDARGRVVPTASNLVTFDVSPNARILGVGNGDPASHEPDTFVSQPLSRPLTGWRMTAVDDSENRPEASADFDDSGWKAVPRGSLANSMPSNSSAVYRAAVDLSGEDAARFTDLSLQVDDIGTVYVNGKKVGETDDWSRAYVMDVSGALKAGRNSVAVVVRNNDGAGGIGPLVTLTGIVPAPQPERSAFNGLCQVVVQAGDAPGDIRLSARADGLQSGILALPMTAAAPRPAVP